MKKDNQRLVLYAKDVMKVVGRCERTTRIILADIRKKYNREYKRGVTVDDFCHYFSLDKEKLLSQLF